ncbi:MAG: hypothetical protein AAFN77_08195 [Planctomycetota bacterium]
MNQTLNANRNPWLTELEMKLTGCKTKLGSATCDSISCGGMEKGGKGRQGTGLQLNDG